MKSLLRKLLARWLLALADDAPTEAQLASHAAGCTVRISIPSPTAHDGACARVARRVEFEMGVDEWNRVASQIPLSRWQPIPFPQRLQ